MCSLLYHDVINYDLVMVVMFTAVYWMPVKCLTEFILVQCLYCGLKNGVKQGGVISPILLNLYIERVLVTLKNSGLGCHIHGTYMGTLSYADDITLSYQVCRV